MLRPKGSSDQTTNASNFRRVIDRLVAAKLVRRVADPTDRRRVVVELVSNPRREREIAGLFGPMGTRIRSLIARYSERGQAIIAEFLPKASEVLQEETTRLARDDVKTPTVRSIRRRRRRCSPAGHVPAGHSIITTTLLR